MATDSSSAERCECTGLNSVRWIKPKMNRNQTETKPKPNRNQTETSMKSQTEIKNPNLLQL